MNVDAPIADVAGGCVRRSSSKISYSAPPDEPGLHKPGADNDPEGLRINKSRLIRETRRKRNKRLSPPQPSTFHSFRSTKSLGEAVTLYQGPRVGTGSFEDTRPPSIRRARFSDQRKEDKVDRERQTTLSTPSSSFRLFSPGKMISISLHELGLPSDGQMSASLV